MTPDHQSDDLGEPDLATLMPRRAGRLRAGGRRTLFLGVAAACAAGVGLGLWARPAINERHGAVGPGAEALATPPTPARKLQIVIDDHPAPVGAPLAVLPAETAPHTLLPPPVIPPVLTRPSPTTTPALMRVDDVSAQSAPPKRVVVKTKATDKAAAHGLERAQTAQKAQANKAVQAEKQAQRQLAKAAKQQQIELAKAEAKGRAEARAEAQAAAKAQALAEAREEARKQARLAALTRAFQHVLPHAAKPAPVEVAKVDGKQARKAHHAARIEQASLKSHKPQHLAEAPPRARAAAPTPPPPQHPSGLMKVSTPRCASPDPGEAMVCADPNLGAADRQLARAYQSARAAGVPDAQLRQQQQRWLVARASMAREAPWAVHDVYLARIAELNGQAREAHGAGY